MPGFAGMAGLVDADNSQSQYVTWRKTPTQATTIGIWFDLSMSPGNPVPQYYAAAPLVAQTLARSTDGGLLNGMHGNVSPARRHVRRIMAMTATATPLPMPMILCDYLLYYPFVDEGSTDPQIMTNVQTIPRYPTGAGVQMMAIIVGSQVGGQTFTVSYTNSAGVSGRTSQTVTMTSNQSTTGTILTSDRAVAGCGGPFIPLQRGDSGVRSIESVTVGGIGDVGLFTLVLIKPLAQMQIRGIDAPVELDYLKDFSNMPAIQDDAYLSFLCCPAGSLSGVPIHGDMILSWN